LLRILLAEVQTDPWPHSATGKNGTGPFPGGKAAGECAFRALISLFIISSDVLFITSPIFTYLLHGAETFFEKLTGFQLAKKFPALHGARNFITAFTSARHMSI
jgi:hypothetical protein